MISYIPRALKEMIYKYVYYDIVEFTNYDKMNVQMLGY